ncbi:MAG TPA: homocysteine S-methyltransferase family protein [Candidatus Limnocylindrales bacterium]|nr:homocysteine S-methyltransferase family protein [Candidatus Limnocylindrales bacterium]
MALHPIHQRLVRGELVLLDGALGTELERRGVATPLPLWSAQALIDAPDIVRQVHEEYARAGADVLATATFRTTPRVMRKAGRPESDADRLTDLAVRLAAEARTHAGAGQGRDVWIGGSLGPLEDCYRPGDAPPRGEMEREHDDQAARLKRAGAELILLETMNTIEEAMAAGRAARSTGLPFTVSFVCSSGSAILSGESLADAVRAVERLEPLAILVNCTPLSETAACLDTMSRATQIPIGCYPNAGSAGAGGTSSFDPSVTPERFASFAGEWVRHGAQLMGGCCGTTPEHIRALREALPSVLVE